MSHRLSPHPLAVLQALFVTVLWASSWVFIKIGLADLPALPFAGLRYMLAVVCLLPFVVRPAPRTVLRGLTGPQWARLVVLGVLYIAVAQGAQFLALAYLPAVTVSLLLNFTPVVVAGLGLLLLGERPTPVQWGGVGLFLVGALVYFTPVAFPASEVVGLGIAVVCVLANAGSAVLGRHVNRAGAIPPLVVTVVSMGVGAALLLGGGVLLQGLPALTLRHWVIIGWLAVVNTAFAFTLWNRTLRTLSAMESSIINSTMMVQIALLAWLFLGETLTGPKLLGLGLAGLGALIVQVRWGRRRTPAAVATQPEADRAG
jgi:drug/metabolite transporter (DMT)-like permease